MSQREDPDRRKSERRARRIARGRMALAATTGLIAGAGMVLARTVRARRVKDTSAQTREISNLLSLAQSIVASDNLHEAVERLLHAAGRAARSQWAAVYLVNEVTSELTLSGTRGTAEPGIVTDSLPLTSTLNVGTCSLLPGSKGSPQSILCVPLTCGGKAIAVVALGRRLSERFRPDECAAVSRLAIHASEPLRRIVEIEALRALAARDPLTGLDNKRRFWESLENEVARAERYNHPMTLIMLDIDGFKAYNDTHGHPAGDGLLVKLSDALLKAMRESDHPARIGGDEFAVICPMTGQSDSVAIAERIRQLLPGAPTVSVGTSTFPADARTAETLFSVADTALYAAKRAGGDQVCSVATTANI